MATDPFLLDRINQIISSKNVNYYVKKMFGGNCYMVDDKMCFGTFKGGMMARIEPDESDELIKKEGASIMIHGGRPMAGYLFLEPIAYDTDDELEFWIQKCLDFNPKAKSSKKK